VTAVRFLRLMGLTARDALEEPNEHSGSALKQGADKGHVAVVRCLVEEFHLAVKEHEWALRRTLKWCRNDDVAQYLAGVVESLPVVTGATAVVARLKAATQP
jgi:hypothetical protein